MEVITFNFITSLGYKNHGLPGENEIKKMITTIMLRRQVWTNDDEFNYIVKNSQRILKLNDQYENHPYVEEFTKQCNFIFIYEI